MAVSAISQNQLPFAKMKATQFLSRRLIRQFVMIANQFGQANAVMNAPIGTRASRLLHICRIDGSHSVIAGPSAPSQSPLLFGQQMLAKVLQPPFGFAQSLEQRHAADLGQRSEEHTSELQSQSNLVCRLLLEKKNKNKYSKSLRTLQTV